MNILKLTLVLVFTVNLISAQTSITEMTSIPVKVTSNHEIIYVHVLQKSETLYSLAKLFKIPLQDLMLVNDISKNQILALGTQIIVPINSERLIISAVKSNPNWIPITYKVKRKETLYRISKGYFNQNIQQLMGRNNLTKLSLSLGQELIVGWWSTERTEKLRPTLDRILKMSDQKYPNDTVLVLNKLDSIVTSLDNYQAIDSLVNHEVDLPKILSNKGIAIWERTDPNDDFLFVLHKTAKVGSVIKLQHPVTNNIVVAEVVDKLPSGSYSEDVVLIISKAVAQKLGALETRFQVGMTYYE